MSSRRWRLEGFEMFEVFGVLEEFGELRELCVTIIMVLRNTKMLYQDMQWLVHAKKTNIFVGDDSY